MTATTPPAPVAWALAGYGAGGRTYHRPLITSAAGLDLVAVVTRSADRRTQLATDAPGVVAVDDLADLVDLGVNGVTVTTPSATHAEVAHRSLDLGLNVVVDKPFALTADAAAELVRHAADPATPGLLTVYQNRRWDSDLLTVRRLLADNVFGRVTTFTSRIDRFRTVKPGWAGGSADEGGGALLDLGPHLVDQAVLLFGPVTTVYAELRTVRDGAGAEDDLLLSLEHATGVRSRLIAGMASAAPGPRLQINGTAGGFAIGGFDNQEAQLKAGGSPASLGDAWGVEPESAWGRLYTADGQEHPVPSERGRWDTFYPAVAAAVRGDGSVPVDPSDAVHTAQVLDAARVSTVERATVTLTG